MAKKKKRYNSGGSFADSILQHLNQGGSIILNPPPAQLQQDEFEQRNIRRLENTVNRDRQLSRSLGSNLDDGRDEIISLSGISSPSTSRIAVGRGATSKTKAATKLFEKNDGGVLPTLAGLSGALSNFVPGAGVASTGLSLLDGILGGKDERKPFIPTPKNTSRLNDGGNIGPGDPPKVRANLLNRMKAAGFEHGFSETDILNMSKEDFDNNVFAPFRQFMIDNDPRVVEKAPDNAELVKTRVFRTADANTQQATDAQTEQKTFNQLFREARLRGDSTFIDPSTGNEIAVKLGGGENAQRAGQRVVQENQVSGGSTGKTTKRAANIEDLFQQKNQGGPIDTTTSQANSDLKRFLTVQDTVNSLVDDDMISRTRLDESGNPVMKPLLDRLLQAHTRNNSFVQPQDNTSVVQPIIQRNQGGTIDPLSNNSFEVEGQGGIDNNFFNINGANVALTKGETVDASKNRVISNNFTDPRSGKPIVEIDKSFKKARGKAEKALKFSPQDREAQNTIKHQSRLEDELFNIQEQVATAAGKREGLNMGGRIPYNDGGLFKNVSVGDKVALGGKGLELLGKGFQAFQPAEIEVPNLDNTAITQSQFSPQQALQQISLAESTARQSLSNTVSPAAQRAALQQLASNTQRNRANTIQEFTNLNQQARERFEDRQSNQARFNAQQRLNTQNINAQNRGARANAINSLFTSIGNVGVSAERIFNQRDRDQQILNALEIAFPDVFADVLKRQKNGNE